MRILAGKWKGKKISSPDRTDTRPTKSIVREAIFDAFDFSNLLVFDCFCGSGAICFEALSNGAKFCYMSDNSREAFSTVLDNAKHLDCLDSIKIFCSTANVAIKRLINKKVVVDVIFMDPPYSKDFFSKKQNIISQCLPISHKGTKFIIETGEKVVFPKFFDCFWQRKYGNTYVYVGHLIDT